MLNEELIKQNQQEIPVGKTNERGQPFQRLEERVFARYISDLICGYAELSQINKEILPELAGEAKLIRVALNRIAASLEKLSSSPPSPTKLPSSANKSIQLDVSDDVNVVLNVRDALFQTALLLEDRAPQEKILVPSNLDNIVIGADTASTATTNTNKATSGRSYHCVSEDAERAQSLPDGPRAQYVRDHYPPELYQRVVSLFLEYEETEETLPSGVPKYTDVRGKMPRLQYYLYGRNRVWQGFSEFRASYIAWAKLPTI